MAGGDEDPVVDIYPLTCTRKSGLLIPRPFKTMGRGFLQPPGYPQEDQ